MNPFANFLDFIANPLGLLAVLAGFVAGAIAAILAIDLGKSGKNAAKQEAERARSKCEIPISVPCDSAGEDDSIPKKLERAKEFAILAEIGNESKSRFIVRMMHEIRSSLNIIMGMAQLMDDEKAEHVPRKEFIVPISNASKRLLCLTDEIAEFTTRDRGGILMTEKRTAFDLARLCSELVNEEKPGADARKISLQLIYPDNAPRSFYGDHYRLAQAISSLLSYALRFTKKDPVVLHVSKTPREDASYAHMEIKIEFGDSSSISHEEFKTVDFTDEDAESARKSGNVRLNLAVCDFLMKTLGGTIRFVSEEGRRPAFVAEIPLMLKTSSPEKKSGDAPESEEKKSLSIEGLRALLAEDDPINRQLEKIFLQKIGLIVETASDGIEAVQKFSASDYDIVFMDCEMPGLDGFSATRKIREIENDGRRRTPIIAMTAYALSGDRDKCIEAGMDDYVSKPINVKELSEITAKRIGKSHSL